MSVGEHSVAVSRGAGPLNGTGWGWLASWSRGVRLARGSEGLRVGGLGNLVVDSEDVSGGAEDLGHAREGDARRLNHDAYAVGDGGLVGDR